MKELAGILDHLEGKKESVALLGYVSESKLEKVNELFQGEIVYSKNITVGDPHDEYRSSGYIKFFEGERNIGVVFPSVNMGFIDENINHSFQYNLLPFKRGFPIEILEWEAYKSQDIDPRTRKIIHTLHSFLGDQNMILSVGSFLSKKNSEYDFMCFDEQVYVYDGKKVYWNEKVMHHRSGNYYKKFISEFIPTLTDFNKDHEIVIENFVLQSHLPKKLLFIDYVTPHYEEAREHVESIKMPGLFVGSGNSYHFYGVDPLKSKVWRKQLESFKGNEIIDQKYLEFSLDFSMSGLRITPLYNKRTVPCLLDIIG